MFTSGDTEAAPLIVKAEMIHRWPKEAVVASWPAGCKPNEGPPEKRVGSGRQARRSQAMACVAESIMFWDTLAGAATPTSGWPLNVGEGAGAEQAGEGREAAGGGRGVAPMAVEPRAVGGTDGPGVTRGAFCGGGVGWRGCVVTDGGPVRRAPIAGPPERADPRLEQLKAGLTAPMGRCAVAGRGTPGGVGVESGGKGPPGDDPPGERPHDGLRPWGDQRLWNMQYE